MECHPILLFRIQFNRYNFWWLPNNVVNWKLCRSSNSGYITIHLPYIFCNEKINSTLVSTVAVAAFVGLYSVNNVLGATLNSSNSKVQVLPNKTISSSSLNKTKSTITPSASKASKYKDGTYTGVGKGFRPGLTVSVTIKNDKMTNIQIVAINDTSSYYSEPVNTIPSEIIQAQSTNVDAVSGATRSSDGIMMAVKDALSQAKL